MAEEELYTREQAQEYAENMVRQYAQEKSNLHGFFTKVIETDDTSKTANLREEELGEPQITVRALKELELFSRKVEENKEWADFFKELAEINLATSLSKEGFLMRLSVTNKKEVADVTPKRKSNKGWFKKGGSK